MRPETKEQKIEAARQYLWPQMKFALTMIWLAAGAGLVAVAAESLVLGAIAIFLAVSYLVRVIWLGSIVNKYRRSLE